MNTQNGTDETLLAEEELNVTTDNTSDNNEEIIDDNSNELSVEDLKAQLEKAQKIAENQKIRAEKAESKLKQAPEVKKVATKQDESLSTTDIFTLVKANVPEEDISDIQRYAKFEGISIKEALSSNFVKTLLADKAEQRAIAAAMHVGSSRRTNNTKSDIEVLKEAERGILPDDPSLIVKARQQMRLADRQSRRN